MTHRNVLGPFQGFLRDYRKLVWGMLALGAANAVLDLVASLGPPWPDRKGTVTYTVIAAWVVLLWSFSVWRPSSQQKCKSRLSTLALGFLLLAAFYALLKSFFVYDTPKPGYEVPSGFMVRETTKQTMRRFPTVSLTEMLDGAAYEPREIWDPWTVNLVQWTILLNWIAVFSCLSLIISAFLVLRESSPKDVWPKRRPSRLRSMSAGKRKIVEAREETPPPSPTKDTKGGPFDRSPQNDPNCAPRSSDQ